MSYGYGSWLAHPFILLGGNMKSHSEMTESERLDFEESQRERADMERERELDDYLTGRAKEIFCFDNMFRGTKEERCANL